MSTNQSTNRLITLSKVCVGLGVGLLASSSITKSSISFFFADVTPKTPLLIPTYTN